MESDDEVDSPRQASERVRPQIQNTWSTEQTSASVAEVAPSRTKRTSTLGLSNFRTRLHVTAGTGWPVQHESSIRSKAMERTIRYLLLRSSASGTTESSSRESAQSSSALPKSPMLESAFAAYPLEVPPISTANRSLIR